MRKNDTQDYKMHSVCSDETLERGFIGGQVSAPKTVGAGSVIIWRKSNIKITLTPLVK